MAISTPADLASPIGAYPLFLQYGSDSTQRCGLELLPNGNYGISNPAACSLNSTLANLNSADPRWFQLFDPVSGKYMTLSTAPVDSAQVSGPYLSCSVSPLVGKPNCYTGFNSPTGLFKGTVQLPVHVWTPGSAGGGNGGGSGGGLGGGCDAGIDC